MELITVNEAMRRLSVGRTTVYRMISEQRITSVKIGSARRIRLDSIKRLAESGEDA